MLRTIKAELWEAMLDIYDGLEQYAHAQLLELTEGRELSEMTEEDVRFLYF